MGCCCPNICPINRHIIEEIPCKKDKFIFSQRRFVLQWKRQIYSKLDSQHTAAKFWNAEYIAKCKSLASIVAGEAIERVQRQGKIWVTAELNQLYQIKENQIQKLAYRNEMVNQNDIYLSSKDYDDLHIKQRLNGQHENNHEKIINGAINAAGKIII